MGALGDLVRGLGRNIKNAVGITTRPVTQTARNAAFNAKMTGNYYGRAAARDYNNLKSGYGTFKEQAGGAISSYGDSARGTWSSIKSVAEPPVKNFTSQAGDVISSYGESARGSWNSAKQAVGNNYYAARNNISNAATRFDNWKTQGGVDLLTAKMNFDDYVNSGLGHVDSGLRKVASGIVPDVKRTGAALGRDIKTDWHNKGQQVSGAINSAKNEISEMVAPVKNYGREVGNAWAPVGQSIKDIGSTVGDSARSMVTTVGNNVRSMGSAVSSNIRNAGSAISNGARSAASGLTDSLDYAGTQAGSTAGSIITGTLNKLSTANEKISNLKNGIRQTVNDLKAPVVGSAEDLAQTERIEAAARRSSEASRAAEEASYRAQAQRNVDELNARKRQDAQDRAATAMQNAAIESQTGYQNTKKIKSNMANAVDDGYRTQMEMRQKDTYTSPKTSEPMSEPIESSSPPPASNAQDTVEAQANNDKVTALNKSYSDKLQGIFDEQKGEDGKLGAAWQQTQTRMNKKLNKAQNMTDEQRQAYADKHDGRNIYDDIMEEAKSGPSMGDYFYGYHGPTAVGIGLPVASVIGLSNSRGQKSNAELYSDPFA